MPAITLSLENRAPSMLKVPPGFAANALVIFCCWSRNSCCQAARSSGVRVAPLASA
jgi:hypothetical protein